MQRTRQILRIAVTISLVLLILPIGSEFFIELARERGVYENPTATITSAVPNLAALTASWWFALALGFFAGATAALWLDYWLRGGARGIGGPKLSDFTKISDPEVVQLLSDARRLYRMLSDFGEPEKQRDEVAVLISQIEISDHAAWLDDTNSQLRVDLLHWSRIAQKQREQHGPMYKNMDDREETLGVLRAASERLQKRMVAQSSK